MTKAELIRAMGAFPDDTPVYLSTGSSMDNDFGCKREVEDVYPHAMAFGPKKKYVDCIVLEGS